MMADLDPGRRAPTAVLGAVVPRPAATVILIRPGEAGGFETFMVRRSARSYFAADAVVFPGGTVDDADCGPESVARSPSLTVEEAHARLTNRGGEPPETAALSFGLHVAAVRELFEEAGVLLATNRGGRLLADRDPALTARLAEDRGRVQRGEMTLAGIAEREGLNLACDRLVYFSHWVTPPTSPRRYDTRFFVAAMPPGQEALHCQIETTEGEWLSPAEALGRGTRGQIKLVQATVAHLDCLAHLRSVDEVLDFARRKPIQTVHPLFDASAGAWVTNVPEDSW